jgi:hypothetical protein
MVIFLIFATPVAVLYGCSWWYYNRDRPGWRIGISKAGVVYGILILSAMAAFFLGAPRNSPNGAEVPYVYHWAPLLARASALCLVFAILGKGGVRIALAIAALGGVAFASMTFALL